MAEAELHKVIKHLRNVLVMQDDARMTDGDLLQRYLQRRDEAAFEALVRRHGPMVLAVCRRVLRNLHDAEDAFQATFLVLVRKASSLQSPSRVGNWLYGVAFRTAQEAKRAALKRRAKEATAVPRSGTSVDSWSDLREVLDQELERLPEKYRSVVVLCDLEGASGNEAARRLALPEGTVASRLARGRAMLAKRLARHGLALSAGSLAVVVSQSAGSECVPTSLLVSTIKAATLFAAGKAATAGLVSVEVAALTEGVLTAMLLSKVKIAMAVLLVALTLVTGTGVMMSQASRSDSQEKKSQGSGGDTQEKKDASPAQTPQEGDKVTASPEEIGNAYLTNMALVDEKFTGKRIAVTGKMYRITGGATSGEVSRSGQTIKGPPTIFFYHLEMRYSSGTGVRLLEFQFASDDRKQLARLKAGQQLTVEGEPTKFTFEGDPKRSPDERPILFLNCKILNPKGD